VNHDDNLCETGTHGVKVHIVALCVMMHEYELFGEIYAFSSNYTLKMEAVYCFETLAPTYETTRCRRSGWLSCNPLDLCWFMFCLNLGEDTDSPEGYRGFSQPLQTSAGIVRTLGHD
jgi:hypothetical protein